MNFSPTFKSPNFQCPHCQIVSQQNWFDTESSGRVVNEILVDYFYAYRLKIKAHQQETIYEFINLLQDINFQKISSFVPEDFAIATCLTCKKISVWVNQEMVYPKQLSIEPPNEDMESEIQELYIEASKIVYESPKGAAALLRLALQKLLKQLKKKGDNINNDIKELVKEGLSPKIQQALDLLRVVGNEAVHPGQIDFDDNRDIAFKLFRTLNFIANEMITKPKEIEHFYNDIIPEEKKETINRRDGK